MLEPKDTAKDDAIILEFKVQGAKEKDLPDTVSEALRQIEEKVIRRPWWQREFLRSEYESMVLLFAGKMC